MSSRIPISLQAVFLSSSRGNDVYVAPPEKAGNRTFLRNWRLGFTTSTSQEKIKNLAASSSNSSSSSPKKQQPVVTYAAAAPTRGRSVRSLFGHSHDKIKQLEKCKKDLAPSSAKSFIFWGDVWGSNPRPMESQSIALPTELTPPP